MIEEARRGKTVVFTNGVFDILHAGHVDYLEKAKALGELLIVAVNSDASVAGLGKGPNRPINPLADRMRVVGALRCVDFVLSFDEATPQELIAQLRPDIHVKGGDYRAEDLPEAETIRAYGGRIIIIPLLPGRSTTEVIRKMTLPTSD